MARRRRVLRGTGHPSHSLVALYACQVSQRRSGFGSIKQVGVATSIGFPLLVMGVLTLLIFLVSLVGTSTTLWILAGAVTALGLLAAASRRLL